MPPAANNNGAAQNATPAPPAANAWANGPPGSAPAAQPATPVRQDAGGGLVDGQTVNAGSGWRDVVRPLSAHRCGLGSGRHRRLAASDLLDGWLELAKLRCQRLHRSDVPCQRRRAALLRLAASRVISSGVAMCLPPSDMVVSKVAKVSLLGKLWFGRRRRGRAVLLFLRALGQAPATRPPVPVPVCSVAC